MKNQVAAMLMTAYALCPAMKTQANCFDFTKPILIPRFAVPALDGTSFGKTTERQDYAYAMATVSQPILPLLKTLLNPNTIRNNSDTKVTLQDDPAPHFYSRFTETIVIKPTFFLTLEWKEVWATSLVRGSPTKPESFLVSYEKTEGTSHVKHLCGNIVLDKITDQKTRVFLYQELDATRRDASDILNDLNGTIKTISEAKPIQSTSQKQ